MIDFLGSLTSKSVLDLSHFRSKNGLFFRAIYLSVFLFYFLLFELFQSDFTHVPTSLSIYGGLCVLFFFNLLFFLIPQKISLFYEIFLFTIEALVFFSILMISKNYHPLFFLLFHLNIALCAYRFLDKGAFLICLFTGTLLNFLFIFHPPLFISKLYLALFVSYFSFSFIAFFISFLVKKYLSQEKRILKAERSLELTENFSESLFNEINLGLALIDGKLNFHFKNPAFSGLIKKNIKNLSEILEDSYKTGLLRHLRLFKEDSHTESKIRSFHAKIDQLILKGSICPIKNQKDFFFLILEDDTEFIEEEKKSSQEKKMKALGSLSAALAHEIRNPLAAISASIEMFFKEEKNKDQLKDICLKEINRLNDLINEFLDYSRVEKIPYEKFILKDLVEDVLKISKSHTSFSKDIKLDVQLKENKVIEACPNKLKQAFLNIILNSYEALKKGKEKLVLIRLEKRNSKLVLSFEDSAGGVDEKILERLFEPFFSTKDKGTGLGLAITHRIFEDHKLHYSFTNSKRGLLVEIEFDPL